MLLFALGASAQNIKITSEYQPTDYSGLSRALNTYAKNFKAFENELEQYSEYLTNLLSQKVDDDMRSFLNKKYEDISNIRNRLWKNGYTYILKNELREIKASVQNEIVNYNNRVHTHNTETNNRANDTAQSTSEESDINIGEKDGVKYISLTIKNFICLCNMPIDEFKAIMTKYGYEEINTHAELVSYSANTSHYRVHAGTFFHRSYKDYNLVILIDEMQSTTALGDLKNNLKPYYITSVDNEEYYMFKYKENAYGIAMQYKDKFHLIKITPVNGSDPAISNMTLKELML